MEFNVQSNFSNFKFPIFIFKNSRPKVLIIRYISLNYKIWSKCLFIVSDLDYIESMWLNHECSEAGLHQNPSYRFGFKFWKDKIVEIYHLITCNLSGPLELLKSHKLFEISFFECLQTINYFHLFSNCLALSC